MDQLMEDLKLTEEQKKKFSEYMSSRHTGRPKGSTIDYSKRAILGLFTNKKISFEKRKNIYLYIAEQLKDE